MLTETQLDQLNQIAQHLKAGRTADANALAAQMAADALVAKAAQAKADAEATAPRTVAQVTYKLLYALSEASGHPPACQALLSELEALMFPPPPASEEAHGN